MYAKVVSAREAVATIRDGDTLCNAGFVGNGVPDELLEALAQRFRDSGSPRGLTIVFAAGQGDGQDRGLNRIALDGLVSKAIGGHWGLAPKLAQMAVEDRIEAYNIPQGCVSHLFRDIAAKKPGVITKVGLDTFVDPRHGGGRINSRTKEDIVQLVELAGEEWLFYRAFPIHVAFIRATTADTSGNLSMERESLTLDTLAMAMAAKNSGGLVIAQVERLAEGGSIPASRVRVPGAVVDCVVVARPENHLQTYLTPYSPAFSQEVRVPVDSLEAMALNDRKIIARRASFELPVNGVVNLGIGVPEGVASVAAEEKVLKYVTLTAEPGVIGGIPASGLDFGAATNADAVLDQNQQFDFYDGGGLDLACLGMAECDARGNVNVSRFGPRLAGAGGFINISQNSRRVVFVGTFTAGGLEVEVVDGELRIVKEGRVKKFVPEVQQVTFSGAFAARRGTPVIYVTERCVFTLTSSGIELVEVAPGIDIERDILAHIDFEPIVRSPRRMDPGIFRDVPMGLESRLLGLNLDDRVSYSSASNTLFLNFQGMAIRSSEDIEALKEVVRLRFEAAGRKMKGIVNYDGFSVDERLVDAYAAAVEFLANRYYTSISRYTTSAFMRMKLGRALEQRGIAPHIFESQREARDFHGDDVLEADEDRGA